MSKAYEKFEKYDFRSDQTWLHYLNNIFPTPTLQQIQKIKRKWYQKQIDSEFDIDYQPPQQSQNDTNQSGSDQQSTQQSNSHTENCNHESANQKPQKPPNFIIRWLFNIEGYLKFCFMTSIFGLQAFSTIIAVTICILALIRQGKRPRWSKEYARKIVFNEYFHNLWYIVPFYLFPNQRFIFYYFPLFVHFWIGVAEFIRYKQGKLYTSFQRYVDVTHQNKQMLMCQKNKIEVYIFLFFIILLFMGKSNFFMILFYGNFLRIKYIVNKSSQQAFYDINLWIGSKVDQGPAPVRWLLAKFRQLCAWLVKINIPNQQQQQQNN